MAYPSQLIPILNSELLGSARRGGRSLARAGFLSWKAVLLWHPPDSVPCEGLPVCRGERPEDRMC